MLAFVLIFIIGNKAGFIGINCSGAVSWVIFKAYFRSNADNIGSFWLFVSRIVQRIVMTGEDIILSNSGWIWLN